MTRVRAMLAEKHAWVWVLIGFLSGIVVLSLVSRVSGAAGVGKDEPVMVYIASFYDGVFYAGRYFEDEPYVKVGSDVEPDSVVGVIDGMRRFKQTACVRGKIVEVLVQDSQMVYMGQPLFKVQLPPEPKTP